MIRISNCFEPEIRGAINEVERLRKEMVKNVAEPKKLKAISEDLERMYGRIGVLFLNSWIEAPSSYPERND